MMRRASMQISNDRMTRQPPTLTLVVQPDRDYCITLQQTKMVYDQLLADKHSKLYQVLLGKKKLYDTKCAELAARGRDDALEYGVTAQQEINELCSQYSDEVMALRQDYQDKLNAMYTQLEDKWNKEHSKQKQNKMAQTPV